MQCLEELTRLREECSRLAEENKKKTDEIRELKRLLAAEEQINTLLARQMDKMKGMHM